MISYENLSKRFNSCMYYCRAFFRSFWNFNKCKMTNIKGSYGFKGTSRGSCGKNGGPSGTTDALEMILKDKFFKESFYADGFSKTFTAGLTVSVRVKQASEGGIWGIGSTATNHHFYIRSNWACHGSKYLALGADMNGDKWFCILKTACGKSTKMESNQWYTVVGTWDANSNKASVYIKFPGEKNFCPVLTNQQLTIDFKTNPVKKVYLGGDGTSNLKWKSRVCEKIATLDVNVIKLASGTSKKDKNS